MTAVVLPELFSTPAIFLQERLMNYYQAQTEKANIRSQISEIIGNLPKIPTTYEDVVELEETLLSITLQITELRARYDVLEDDYPTPGGEQPFHDGVAI